MQVIKLTLSKTDKSRGNSSIVVSYRKARIISNHLAQLNTVLASTLRATLKSSDLITTEHTQKTKLSNRRGISSSLN